MGCVYNRGTRALPNYWINWREHGKNRYQRIGEDKALAKSTLQQIEAGIQKKKLSRRYGIETEAPPDVPLFGKAADKWIELRSAIGPDGQPSIRSWRDDQTRVNLHLRPRFGQRPLDEITVDDVKALIEALRPTHKAQTIRNVLHTLSRLYEDQAKALRLTNPVRQLERSDRRRIGEGWDPKATPWLQSDEQVRRVYLGFPEINPTAPWRPMFATGVFAGLRPGEIRSLQWSDVDFAARLIHVQRSDGGPCKDGESRAVPLSPALASVLLEWKEACPPPADAPGAPCFPCAGHHGRRVCKDSMLAALDGAYSQANAANGEAKLPRLTWYQSTRHSYGGRFVSAGGSLEKLRVILGHSTTEVTLRYGHLVKGQFSEAERELADVQLQPGKVLPLRGRRT
jgi:integrase